MRPDFFALWTSSEAEILTGGRNTQAWQASGVAVNVDDVQAGDLFIAARDDDLGRVMQKGAAAAVVPFSCDVPTGLPALMVEDSYEALRCLAVTARYRTQGIAVAVQGIEARAVFQDLLSFQPSVHMCGKHLSSGLAAMPEDCDFGIFPVSPSVKPDVVVLANSAKPVPDALFETMPRNGVVLVNGDDAGHKGLISRARAYGLEAIYTYSEKNDADARVKHVIDTGAHHYMSAEILGQGYEFQLSQRCQDSVRYSLAAFLMLKLCGRNLKQYALAPHAPVKTAGGKVALFSQIRRPMQAVFKVKHVIDLGRMKQTAVLDNLASGQKSIGADIRSADLPQSAEPFKFMYTSKTFDTVCNARAFIREKMGSVAVEPISHEVLVPGDFIVFKNDWQRPKTLLTEAMRAVPENSYRKL